MWLSVKQYAELTGKPERTVKFHCRENKLPCRTVKGNGGTRYEILVPDQQLQQDDGSAISDASANGLILNDLNQAQRAFVERYLAAINFEESESTSTGMLKEFLTGCGISYKSYLRMRARYREHGVQGLLPGYGNRIGDTVIPDAVFEVFKSAYLKEGAPGLPVCVNIAKGFAAKNKITVEPFPSAATFLRRLRREVPAPAIALARYGYRHYNKHYHSYIDRDYTGISAGQVWVSDHRQLDQAVILPGQKKPCFPWVTVWRDFLSGLWIGWSLHPEAPNSDHIFEAFYKAAVQYGIPSEIIIDNGKDYRCKDFSGGLKHSRKHKLSLNEITTRSLMGGLNINVRFALPYNAQTKPIERDFLVMKSWLDKNMPGYRGGNIVERPEILASEIKSGKILKYDEYQQVFESFVQVLNNTPSMGKNHNGLTRQELWNQTVHPPQQITKEALKLFCMRTSRDYTIGRNGITLSAAEKLYYWGEWMIPLKGTRAYLRRDPLDYQTAWVFDSETHAFLGQALLNAWSAPALEPAADGKANGLERSTVSRLLADKRRQLNIITAYAQVDSLNPADTIQYLSLGLTGTDHTAPVAADHSVRQLTENNHSPITRLTPMDAVWQAAQQSAVNPPLPPLPPDAYDDKPRRRKLKLFEDVLPPSTQPFTDINRSY